ncbi:MAG: hypothetical protein ACI9MR_000834 [Myxococcota bacterium]|jgi:hypothetical protein
MVAALPSGAEPPAATAALPTGLQCLLTAYPDTLCRATPEAIYHCDGTRIPWDDGVPNKPFKALLEQPDLEEMMRTAYPAGPMPSGPTPLPRLALPFEPGRWRHEPLFEAMYGDTKNAVRARLERVKWLPRSGGRGVLMTRTNGAAAALKRVSDDIQRELPWSLRKLAATTSGTFNWRTVRKSPRRSMHSFGIAIDVAVKQSDYWAWNRPASDGRYRYKNRFPYAVAKIFERHGFIWGGKWEHFDTMHFEYRPELLVAACIGKPLGKSADSETRPNELGR